MSQKKMCDIKLSGNGLQIYIPKPKKIDSTYFNNLQMLAANNIAILGDSILFTWLLKDESTIPLGNLLQLALRLNGDSATISSEGSPHSITLRGLNLSSRSLECKIVLPEGVWLKKTCETTPTQQKIDRYLSYVLSKDHAGVFFRILRWRLDESKQSITGRPLFSHPKAVVTVYQYETPYNNTMYLGLQNHSEELITLLKFLFCALNQLLGP